MKKALITGITGQDGSYLTELLLTKDYEVHGVMRRCSVFNTKRLEHLMASSNYDKRFFLHHGDITDPSSIDQLVAQIKPDEIYNLAAQSHVKVSFEVPYYTAQVDALGTLNVLEAVRNHCPTARIYQASTSELYGGMGYNMPPTGYDEQSPFHPRSPYGVAKLYAFWIIKNYREAYNLFACNGILFNHESPRRGDTFVTKKITNWCRRYRLNPTISPLLLGNLEAKRDWGHAADYVEAMWLMLQQSTPEDFVIASGEVRSVKEFVAQCFQVMGINLEWEDAGVDCKGFAVHPSNNVRQLVVAVDPKYFRPSEVAVLLGNAKKAETLLGWRCRFSFEDLVRDMMINPEGKPE